MKAFDISIGQDTVAVKQGGKASLTFTVTNVSGRALRALLKLVPEKDEHTGWLAIDGEARRDVQSGQTANVVVKIGVPRDAPPGAGKLRLVVACEENPDEDFAEAVAAFTVGEVLAPPTLPHCRWWILGAAASAVVAAAAVIILLLCLTGLKRIPSVIDMEYEQATKTLDPRGFSNISKPPSILQTLGSAKAVVRDQEPSAGSWVPAYEPIRLKVGFNVTWPEPGNESGKPFVDPKEIISEGDIMTIETVYSGGGIHGIMLSYGPDRVDGIPRGFWPRDVGSDPLLDPAPTSRSFDVADSDSIIRVEGYCDANVRCVSWLQFCTTKEQNSQRFGKQPQKSGNQSKERKSVAPPGNLPNARLRTISGRADSDTKFITSITSHFILDE